MAVNGFEGFEKRLELHFFGDDPARELGLGLRLIDFTSLQQVLQEVQCTVVSAVGNPHFDSYVLSESSLFVYPNKIIIKTCGTTQLLKSVRPLIDHAHRLRLSISSCKYTRGSFIFPEAQPFPHTSFSQEAVFLEQILPLDLCLRKASVMASEIPSLSWHVFSACHPDFVLQKNIYTFEVCMTELDGAHAGKFFLLPGNGKTGDSAGKDMTRLTGIDEINPSAIICDFAFDPCGYSMNGIHGNRFSTIHVTPEDGFSYASFECMGQVSAEDDGDIARTLKKVVHIFRPTTMSVSTTCSGHNEVWKPVAEALESVGFKSRSWSKEEFPAAATIVFQTFTSSQQ